MSDVLKSIGYILLGILAMPFMVLAILSIPFLALGSAIGEIVQEKREERRK